LDKEKPFYVFELEKFLKKTLITIIRFYIYIQAFLFVSFFIYCFTSCLRIFHLYGDVIIAGEGLQKLGLCSALRAFEQGGIFIVPQLL
jgi:hypothetical protein